MWWLWEDFYWKGRLKSHCFIHSEVQPYTCDDCGKTFTQNSALKNHRLMHSGVKPYRCDDCGKSLDSKGSENSSSHHTHWNQNCTDVMTVGRRLRSRVTWNVIASIIWRPNLTDVSTAGKRLLSKANWNVTASRMIKPIHASVTTMIGPPAGRHLVAGVAWKGTNISIVASNCPHAVSVQRRFLWSTILMTTSLSVPVSNA